MDEPITDGQLLDMVYEIIARDMSDAVKVQQVAQLLEVHTEY